MKLLRYALLALMALLFLAAMPSSYAQESDATCSDGIDNNGNGLIDLDDPTCQMLSEEPVATVAPTAEPTAEVTATAEPTATIEPTATPTTLPDTGGNPSQDGTQPPADPAFSEWLAQSGAIGIIVAFIVMLITVFKVTLSSNIKRGLALGIGVVLALVYVATKDDLAIDSPNDVFLTALSVLASSQIAYLLATGAIQTFVREQQE